MLSKIIRTDAAGRTYKTRPVTTFNMKDSPSEIGSRKKAEFIQRDILKDKEAISKVSSYLASQTGQTPSIGQVLDFIEQRLPAMQKPGLGAGQIARAEAAGAASMGAATRFEDEQMARLLRGPLRPGRG